MIGIRWNHVESIKVSYRDRHHFMLLSHSKSFLSFQFNNNWSTTFDNRKSCYAFRRIFCIFIVFKTNFFCVLPPIIEHKSTTSQIIFALRRVFFWRLRSSVEHHLGFSIVQYCDIPGPVELRNLFATLFITGSDDLDFCSANTIHIFCTNHRNVL